MHITPYKAADHDLIHLAQHLLHLTPIPVIGSWAKGHYSLPGMDIPLAEWTGLRFPSSGSWVQSHPVDQYVCTGHQIPMGQGSGMGLCASA
jgi:hypothetical protein